jgi:hypothetical protein
MAKSFWRTTPTELDIGAVADVRPLIFNTTGPPTANAMLMKLQAHVKAISFSVCDPEMD